MSMGGYGWLGSEVKEKLGSKCAGQIFKTQKEASEDFAADAMLSELCTDDAQVRALAIISQRAR